MNKYNKIDKDKDRAFIIGLTGGIGSGKSAAADILKRWAYIIDTDQVSRELMSIGTQCYAKVCEVFPQAVSGGVLQRALLKELIFADESSRKKLNSITHPYILQKVIQEAEGKKLVVVQVPLLFESGFDKLCDITLSILASKEQRIKRITARDNISAELAQAIIATQLSNEVLSKRSDYFINNNGSFGQLEEAIEEFYSDIKKRI